MTSNLYKVGDWVYCETSPFQPYVIRKIEELTKTPSGNVEAKVLCAFRLQEIPQNVLTSVERYAPKNNTKEENKPAENGATNSTETEAKISSNAQQPQQQQQQQNSTYFEEHEVTDLNENQRYQLKHREVFYSKFSDTIAATSIRAKCSVLLFNEEIEKYSEYINREDSFFYHLTYDPYQKSLINDKGEIRVGFRYQTEIPQLLRTQNGLILEEPPLDQAERDKQQVDRVLRSKKNNQNEPPPEISLYAYSDEQLEWCPMGNVLESVANHLADEDIDKFLVLAKSVGTYARALDCNNAFKQPSLPLSAASASRDITLQYALDTLHQSNYDIGKAALSLITQNGPVLCKDEIEDWSAAEANLFEDALEKFDKDFNEIRKEYLPWKSLKSIIEYYYTWKTTDRYLQRKSIKTAEQESKLKQVYIPNHSKQNQSALIKSSHVQLFNQYDVHLKQSCESCGCPNTSTNQWYAYNPTTLVQQIMTGNTNPQVLASAQAQAIANLIAAQNGNANGQAANNLHIYQARLCADCWTYWKKHSQFKYANAKQERLNQLKNQVHRCSVNGCSREFKQKALLIKHCGVAHGYFPKVNNPNEAQQRSVVRNRTAFFLLTTPMTRAARFVCTHTINLSKLAKKPFKLVDLSELNKEWNKEKDRSIAKILEKHKLKQRVNEKLDVTRIDKIKQARLSALKSKDDGSEENDLVIMDEDENNQQEKPEYMRYFEQKTAEPSYTPSQLLFPKPTSEQVNKFFMNLMSQNRKRTLEQTNGQHVNGQTNGANGNPSNTSLSHDSDSGPVSKRPLITNPSQNSKNVPASKQQPQSLVRPSQKSNKPIQNCNLPNAPEEIYFLAIPSLKLKRKEIELSAIRKLARKPHYNLTEQFQLMYAQFEKLSNESLAKAKAHKLNNGDKEALMHPDASQSSADSSMHNGCATANGASSQNGEAPSTGVVVLD